MTMRVNTHTSAIYDFILYLKQKKKIIKFVYYFYKRNKLRYKNENLILENACGYLIWYLYFYYFIFHIIMLVSDVVFAGFHKCQQ